jgi:N-acetylglucosaminyldiphosphoundecaprenol N-acetyl-beta-D-mannosaminyltransferase
MSTATPARQERLPETVPLLGLDFAAVSERDTIDHVIAAIEAGRGGWICPVNLDVLRQWRESAEVRTLVSGADLVVADGMPLIWASGVQGTPLPERVAGSTLVVTLTAAATAAGGSIFLLGGNPGTAEAAVARLTELNPDMRVAGTLCPPVGFEADPEWLERIEIELVDADPDIVYVGLGFPKQERLIVELRQRLPSAWFLSCGISFSFVSGEVRRAPVIMQRLGLEWLHRMAQEPKRLFRRYLARGIPFLFVLLWSALEGRLGDQVRVTP